MKIKILTVCIFAIHHSLSFAGERPVRVFDALGESTMCIMVEQPNRQKFSLRWCSNLRMRMNLLAKGSAGKLLSYTDEEGKKGVCSVIEFDSMMNVSNSGDGVHANQKWAVLCDRD